MPDPTAGLELYLVGGAVRDRLLGQPVTDRDWVVVGATPTDMQRRGFRAVGADFPVFLHPVTHEQYALARTERKTAPGYRGFHMHAAPDVTLEQDLARRDLTINAIAQTPHGAIIDPYGGSEDIRLRRLRHVSAAFAEDPVRILRVARFAARFAPLGFVVAGTTMALMRQMVDSGEVDALIAERVWAETGRALGEAAPARFIEVLRACGALAQVLPEIDALFGVPQPARYHPEIDTGQHTLLCLNQCAALTREGAVRFAALVHDLGKALTPRAEWPRHIGHERRGITPIRALCERLRVPRGWRELSELVCRHHLTMHRLNTLRPATVLALLEALDAFRRAGRVTQFAIACEADARGRTGFANRPYPPAAQLAAFADTARAVDLSDLGQAGFTGLAARDEARRRRLTALRAVVQNSQE